MEPLFWRRRQRSGLQVFRRDSRIGGGVTVDAYLQQSGGQTSVQCYRSDSQSADRDHRVGRAARRDPAEMKLERRELAFVLIRVI